MAPNTGCAAEQDQPKKNSLKKCFTFKVSKVEALRIPVNQDQAPDEECFDQIVALLKSTSASTPIVFNCQAGISRSTTGMIIASLIKEFQLASELNHMKGKMSSTPWSQVDK